MKLLHNSLLFLPVFILIFQIIFLLQPRSTNQLNPTTTTNYKIEELVKLLQMSGLKYQQFTIFDHRNEVEFLIVSDPKHSFKTVLSLDKSTLSQVGALQKLIKIANIEGSQIKFVDFSSDRPYATL